MNMKPDLFGYEKEDWFKLTKEQQDEVVEYSLSNSIMNKDLWVKLIDKKIIPKLINQEEYEMVDVFNKIKEGIKKQKNNTDGM
jgi:hypothetical protein